jgi:hypothetical protein
MVRQPSGIPTVEVHVPLSPTQTFFTMVRCLAHSLRRFGGEVGRHARVVLTVGDAVVQPRLAERLPWLDPLGIELRWLPADRYERDSFWATAIDRFRQPFRSDVVLMLDADIVVAGPLDDLVREVHCRQTFAGVPAYLSPFEHAPLAVTWHELFGRLGLGRPELTHEVAGWGTMTTDPAHRFCPPYFNLGVLCAPASVMRAIGQIVVETMHAIDEIVSSPFRCQLAVSAAIQRLGIATTSLPLRYNFANHAAVEVRHADELAKAVILHLAGRPLAWKQQIFGSVGQLAAFADDDATSDSGVVARVREVVRAILPELTASETGVLVEAA